MNTVATSNVLKRKAAKQLQMFMEDCGLSVRRDVTILEIGSKNAYFLEACSDRGIAAIGTEINESHIERMKTSFPHLTIIKSQPDALPLPDASVDFVVSFQVLEHMSHLAIMLAECKRVLRPGGFMYHVCPNYRSFYEEHYKVVWLPFLRKRTGSWYLRLLGRDPKGFQRSIYPVTPPRLRSIFKMHRDLRLVTLGKSEFRTRFNLEQIGKVDVKLIRRVLEAVHGRGPITMMILKLISFLGFYYPLTVIAQKVQNDKARL